MPHRVRIPHPHVQIDPNVLGGSPIVAGSRVPVRRLWAWHRGGTSIETLLKRYPKLGPARVLSALAFAYDNQELIEEDLAHEQDLLANEAEKPPGLRPMAQESLPLEGVAPPTQRGRRLRRARPRIRRLERSRPTRKVVVSGKRP